MNILLADDHGLFRESIKHWLESQQPDLQITMVATHAEVRMAMNNRPLPRLLMLDLCMPGMDGIDSVRSLHVDWPNIPILVVSASDDPVAIRSCIEAGAAGFVSKSGNGTEIIDAVQRMLAGKTAIPSGAMSAIVPQFSSKQLKILRLLAEGLSNREIAGRAHLTEGTVKQYVREILSKLDVGNRVQAGIRACAILGLK